MKKQKFTQALSQLFNIITHNSLPFNHTSQSQYKILKRVANQHVKWAIFILCCSGVPEGKSGSQY